jgi:PadR family transcriptional regulator AphA
MSLKHALLGFLSYGPKTGYDLKQAFDRSVKHFWNASLSQIYPALSTMEKAGFLTVEVEYQESRPNRKIYHITEEGKAELKKWMEEPIGLPSLNIAFLIKIFFGSGLKKEEIIPQLRHYQDLYSGRLKAYRGEVRETLEAGIEKSGRDLDGEFWRLTLEAGIAQDEAWVKWCTGAIKKIEELNF